MQSTKEHLSQPDVLHIRAEQLYREILGHTGREAFLLSADTNQLKAEFFKRRLPQKIRRELERTIAFAEEIHAGQPPRKDGKTPHINHVLRVGIRLMDKAIQERGTLPWYTPTN